jgi:hypothetical protein
MLSPGTRFKLIYERQWQNPDSSFGSLEGETIHHGGAGLIGYVSRTGVWTNSANIRGRGRHC